MSYSAPITVNETPQRIRALPEDRPGLAADKSGRIAVVYYAEEPHGVVPYFSYSLDRGQHFSSPRALSTPASEAEHAMVRLVADDKDRFYLFWYETRAHDPGASLYYTVSDKPEMLSVPDRRINATMCECCRLALDFDHHQQQPVLLARVIFPGSVRDHALITLNPESTRRVTDDDWHIEACPKHGPALSIAADGRYHIAWFTQGEKRKGLFYAYADDLGQGFSQPMRFGNRQSLPEHADVLALGDRVVLAWKEFDGQQTRLLAMQSRDHGSTWSAASVIAESNSEFDQPDLITNGQRTFLSWSALDNGHRLVPMP
ncbi:MAG: exo-alpha-sialidase [Gammaproteobacteria bacterium]